MEQKWREQNITSYQIEVLVASIWHAQYHRITVRDNSVESATAFCIPAPTEGEKCEVEAFNPEDYTVPGLFAKARSQIQSQEAEWTTIIYHPTCGFPELIAYDRPQSIDEEWWWRVTSFEVLG